MKISTLAGFLLPVFLVGCASAPSSISYNPKKSMALNLANAGGVSTGIADTDRPKNTSGTLATSIPYGVAFTASGFSSPALGFTSWGGGAMSLLAFLTTPKSQGERNSIMAFMPSDMATSSKEAQKKLFDLYYYNADKTLSTFGSTNKIWNDEETRKFTNEIYSRNILIQNAEWNCPRENAAQKIKDLCFLKIYVYEPSLLKDPSFVTANSYYYFGASNSRNYNRFVFAKPKSANIPEYEILSALSKTLPNWTYMYVAPKQVTNKSGDIMNFPFILQAGKTELFVKPQ